MRIANNWPSLMAWRSLSWASERFGKTISHLSSGRRIMTAADDMAGLTISQKLMGQSKGLTQANRNAADGMSLVQTAEGALNEITSLLQRGRELSVQAANSTLTDSDKRAVQQEIDQILAEIDRISDMTVFNDKRLLNQSGDAAAIGATLMGLRSGWLEQAEQVIFNNYGISGDGVSLDISLESGGSQSAWVTGTPAAGFRLDNLTLHINVEDLGPIPGPDGGPGPIYNDRKVARALTEAVMARTTWYTNLPGWFTSGSADYIAGGVEILNQAIASNGSAAVIAAAGTAGTDNLHEAANYLAVRYLDSQLTANGFTMKDLMGGINAGDLDSALLMLIGTDTGGFLTDFALNGAAFLTSLQTSGALSGADVGGIGGGDASGVIPNGGSYSLNPTSHFVDNWDMPTAGAPTPVDIQVGPNAGQKLTVFMQDITSYTLNLLGIDMVTGAGQAIERFNTAINMVSSTRNYLGSMANRLEHVASANDELNINDQRSYSLQVDEDFAKLMSEMVRNQILMNSATASLAQANMRPRAVLRLLRGAA